MSTALVAAEIRRFLASKEAEVLCIKGKWGVGKTFAWRTFLADAQARGKSRFDQYSYVSLFGLNSLDDLRYAIVEGTVPSAQAATGPTVDTMSTLLKQGFGKTRPYLETTLAFFGKKDFGAALSKAAFLLVRNQIVCFDDLERAGKGLEARDVLGLASSLKEQRGCKVVLLLNDEQMKKKDREEFERLLEKVVDVSLVFAPTSPEAAGIALPDTDPFSELLRDRVAKLDIVNIRVIKKIERWAGQLFELLKAFPMPILDQAMATVTLAGWAKLQKDGAPDLNFLKKYNSFSYAFARQAKNAGQEAADEPSWIKVLETYIFAHADELDQAIIDGVDRGYFDAAAVTEAAAIVQKKLETNPDTNSLSLAWEQLRNTLTVDDDAILGALYAGGMENLTSTNVPSMNSTIGLLRDMGWHEQADALLRAFVEAHKGDHAFFDLRDHHFLATNEVDPALRRAFQEQYDSFIDTRDPAEVLLGITRKSGWNERDVRLLARLTADDWVQVIDRCEGPDVMGAIETAQRLVPQAGDLSDAFGAALTEAVHRIASRSPLRARRMRKFGVTLPQAAPDDQEQTQS